MYGTLTGGFGGSPVFDRGASGFGTSPTFGGAPTFGGSPTFGSPGKVFGSSPSAPPGELIAVKCYRRSCQAQDILNPVHLAVYSICYFHSLAIASGFSLPTPRPFPAHLLP
jgi:hypothetical protein